MRDLQWRRRRFVIAVLGTSLVLSLTLLLTGYQRSFGVEVDRTVKLIDADGFLVQEGRPGPFLGGTPIPLEIARRAAEIEGVEEFAPLVMSPQVTDRKVEADVFVIGARQDGLGAAKPETGRAPQAPGEAVVDSISEMKVGDTFGVSGTQFKVVGTTSGLTYSGGRPTIHMSLEDAQQVMFAGQPYVSTVAVNGSPKNLPDGVNFMDANASKQDLKRPLKDVVDSITMFRSLLWVVAIALVGSVVYLSALERIGDFAVFKATGTATADLLGALVVQAIALSVSASVLAIGLAYLLRGLFPVEPQLPADILITLPLVGLVIGVLASGAALRRAVSVDPALAFGGH